MLETIKGYLSTIKAGILYIIGPIVAIIGYIVYLRNKNSSLQDQINQSKAAKELATVIEKKVEDEKQSNVDQSDYESIRAQYLAQQALPGLGDAGHPDQAQSNMPPDNSSSGQDNSIQKPSSG